MVNWYSTEMLIMYGLTFASVFLIFLYWKLSRKIKEAKENVKVTDIKNDITLKNLQDSLSEDEIKIKSESKTASKLSKKEEKIKAKLDQEFISEQKDLQQQQLNELEQAHKERLNSIMDDESGYMKAKEFNYHKARSRWTTRYWKDWFLDKYLPDKVVMINMELLNGFHKQFLVRERDGAFYYKKKVYVLDNEKKYYVIDSKLYAYDYHEEFTNPIQRKLPIADIKETLESSGISEIEYATSPKTLERFIISKVAEGIMRGQALDEALKQLRLLVIITTVTSVGHFMYILFKTGAFQAVQIPGVNA